MQLEKVQGFLFDLHGVIADSWQYHLASWRTIAEELAIPWTPALAQALPGMSRQASLETILASAQESGRLLPHEFQAVTDHENALYRQYVAAMTPANRLPGITAFLDQLVAAGYPLALASASTNARAEIERLGLQDYFSRIVPAESLAAAKPAPDVYLAAAQLLDADPRACVALEDTLTGVAAAKAAGCIAIGLNRDPLPAADAQLSSTAELSLATVRRVLDRLTRSTETL